MEEYFNSVLAAGFHNGTMYIVPYLQMQEGCHYAIKLDNNQYGIFEEVPADELSDFQLKEWEYARGVKKVIPYKLIDIRDNLQEHEYEVKPPQLMFTLSCLAMSHRLKEQPEHPSYWE